MKRPPPSAPPKPLLRAISLAPVASEHDALVAAPSGGTTRESWFRDATEAECRHDAAVREQAAFVFEGADKLAAALCALDELQAQSPTPIPHLEQRRRLLAACVEYLDAVAAAPTQVGVKRLVPSPV